MAASKTYAGNNLNNLSVTLADPENISRDECLSLAEAGQAAWNTWRNEYPARYLEGKWHNNADFSNRTFASAGPFDFLGFYFGGPFNLSTKQQYPLHSDASI